MKRTCFLDVDGVLANFWDAAVKALGLTIEESHAKVKPGDWHFYKTLGYTDESFWTIIDRDTLGFWERLDKMPDADEIIEVCESQFGKEVYLLTSPPLEPQAFAGKAAWVSREYPEYYRKLFVGPAKDAFAHAGAVLVDDSDDNCKKFRKAGGQAVLVPRRWNSMHKHAARSSDIVTMSLEQIFEGD